MLDNSLSNEPLVKNNNKWKISRYWMVLMCIDLRIWEMPYTIYPGAIVVYTCRFKPSTTESTDLNCTINDPLCHIWTCYFDHGYFWSCHLLKTRKESTCKLFYDVNFFTRYSIIENFVYLVAIVIHHVSSFKHQ